MHACSRAGHHAPVGPASHISTPFQCHLNRDYTVCVQERKRRRGLINIFGRTTKKRREWCTPMLWASTGCYEAKIVRFWISTIAVPLRPSIPFSVTWVSAFCFYRNILSLEMMRVLLVVCTGMNITWLNARMLTLNYVVIVKATWRVVVCSVKDNRVQGKDAIRLFENSQLV